MTQKDKQIEMPETGILFEQCDVNVHGESYGLRIMSDQRERGLWFAVGLDGENLPIAQLTWEAVRRVENLLKSLREKRDGAARVLLHIISWKQPNGFSGTYALSTKPKRTQIEAFFAENHPEGTRWDIRGAELREKL